MKILFIALVVVFAISSAVPTQVFADTFRQSPEPPVATLQTDSPSYILDNKEEVEIELIWEYNGDESEIDVLVEVFITDPQSEIVFDSAER